jgi:hypothetical protein
MPWAQGAAAPSRPKQIHIAFTQEEDDALVDALPEKKKPADALPTEEFKGNEKDFIAVKKKMRIRTKRDYKSLWGRWRSLLRRTNLSKLKRRFNPMGANAEGDARAARLWGSKIPREPRERGGDKNPCPGTRPKRDRRKGR